MKNIGVLLFVIIILLNGCVNTNIPTKTGSTQPHNTNEGGLTDYPDLPLETISEILSVKDVIEHRSALDGKTITVKGLVTSTALENGVGDAQPRIFIADTTNSERDKNYDLMIIIKDSGNYYVNQEVELNGIVHSNKIAVYLEK